MNEVRIYNLNELRNLFPPAGVTRFVAAVDYEALCNEKRLGMNEAGLFARLREAQERVRDLESQITAIRTIIKG